MNKFSIIILLIIILFVILFHINICNFLTLYSSKSSLNTISFIKEGLNNSPPYTLIGSNHPKEYQNINFNWCTIINNTPSYTSIKADYALFCYDSMNSYSLSINSTGYTTYVILCGGGGDGGDGYGNLSNNGHYNGGGGGGGGINCFKINDLNEHVNIVLSTMTGMPNMNNTTYFNTNSQKWNAYRGGNGGSGGNNGISGTSDNYGGSSGGGGGSNGNGRNGGKSYYMNNLNAL